MPQATLSTATPFTLFEQFPEVRVAIIDKRSGRRSNEEAAETAGFRDVAYTEQVHGTTIHIVDSPLAGNIKADGLITEAPNLALSCRWADCQNFVIYVPSQRIIGTLHAGWRGLAKGAIASFFDTLKQRFNIPPDKTFVGAGPSLCKRCATFTDPFWELPQHLHPFIEGKNAVPRTVSQRLSGARVDLQAAADAELRSLGVLPTNFERHPDCTACNPDRYWTFRGGHREEVQAGRGRNYLIAGLAT